MALAYFITFSTYGTWLHGTDKGLGSVDRDHNQPGTPFLEPDARRMEQERESMTQPPYRMDAPRRKVVRDAIVDICREKNWDLLALHVRSNHVHVVIHADRDPGRLMSDLKARASRDLNRLEQPTLQRAAHERAAHEVSGSQITYPAHEVSGRQSSPPAHKLTAVPRKRWTRHGSTLHLFTADQVQEKIRYTIDEQGPMMEWYEKNRTNEPRTNEPRTK